MSRDESATQTTETTQPDRRGDRRATVRPHNGEPERRRVHDYSQLVRQATAGFRILKWMVPALVLLALAIAWMQVQQQRMLNDLQQHNTAHSAVVVRRGAESMDAYIVKVPPIASRFKALKDGRTRLTLEFRTEDHDRAVALSQRVNEPLRVTFSTP